ncbi:MAG: NADH-quinone oxidoreductase subunit J [Xanthomonadales bacterium]|nr:NADH-quinone oxidoreductase subunit J [Xanthomonadales bacterium]MBP6078186.1 NADH-quinone oxidoreductase subunit J [Xanthomonadales bacterium]MBP7623098.1 NADH-quinone oxidoreductase subunit J [Xanthomonadales bacterium]
MSLEALMFYLLATVMVAASVAVVTLRNPVHCALSLVLTFFTCACLWLLLRAEFLAIALVLVYVGAVMVLFLFVVMMLDIKSLPSREGFTTYLPAGLVVALIMLAELIGLMGARKLMQGGGVRDAAAEQGLSNTEWLGRTLFSDYILPFEIAAVILTVAIVAAVALTLRHRPNVRTQDPAKQAATRREDRIRLVDLPSSSDGSKQA